MIYGIGVDIAAVDRFQRFLDEANNALLERLFLPGEMDVCKRRRDAASCLAARFAAKEALLKAIGTGLRDGITWHNMEVTNDHLGKPELVLSGRAAEIILEKRLGKPLLSISHDGGQAVAMVVLEVL